MRYLILLLLLTGCGGGGVVTTAPQPVNKPVNKPVTVDKESSIPLFTKQNDNIGYGGSVIVAGGNATFNSNTNPNCSAVWMCRRVEMSKKVSLPVKFSYSFEVLKWNVDEALCGTYKGIPKGCYIILSQFWNQEAAPRAYAVLQKKTDDLYKLSFHNKNNDGLVDYVWEINIGKGVHTVEVYNDGLGASLTVDGETSGYKKMSVTSHHQEHLKWGMYWQKEMVGDVVIRFSDVILQ